MTNLKEERLVLAHSFHIFLAFCLGQMVMGGMEEEEAHLMADREEKEKG